MYDGVAKKLYLLTGDPSNDPPSTAPTVATLSNPAVPMPISTGLMLLGQAYNASLGVDYFQGRIDTVMTWQNLPSVNDLFYAYKN